ncbi:MAG: transposase [Fuerstiella sp.]
MNHQLRSLKAKCVGFVVMPDHVHAIVWLSATAQLTRFMHGWKRMSSFRVRKWYRENRAEYFDGFGEGARFWQPKYYSFEIYTTQKLEEKLHYMHLNPVRAGLVNTATDWRWSSSGWYDDRSTVGVPIEWVG